VIINVDGDLNDEFANKLIHPMVVHHVLVGKSTVLVK